MLRRGGPGGWWRSPTRVNRWFIRMGLRLVNRFLRFRNVPFSVFVHDPEAIERRLASAGFGPRAGGDTFVWHWRVFERAA